jgi:hypothetical protein
MADLGSSIIKTVVAILGLVGIYYLYKYLTEATKTSAIIISGKQDATTLSIPSVRTGNLPPLYMGGEFAVSTWINVNNWGFAKGRNVPIIRIGNPDTFDTLRIYLGGPAAQLMIRFDTHQGDSKEHYLSNKDATNMNDASVVFSQNASILMGPASPPSTNACDIVHIDLQRWINLVVSVNGMTSDVYINGKLVRSCLLDNYYQVPPNYELSVLDNKDSTGNGGFGGSISTTQIYGQALSPDKVYQDYISGPEPIGNFWDYITSFFTISNTY